MSRVKFVFTINIKLSFDSDLIFLFSYSQSDNIFKVVLKSTGKVSQLNKVI